MHMGLNRTLGPTRHFVRRRNAAQTIYKRLLICMFVLHCSAVNCARLAPTSAAAALSVCTVSIRYGKLVYKGGAEQFRNLKEAPDIVSHE